MTTKAAVGTSYHHNPNVAGREAAEQALRNAGLEKPDFVFMFATVGYDQCTSLTPAFGACVTGGASGFPSINDVYASQSNSRSD
jgi:hypothetical protein